MGIVRAEVIQRMAGAIKKGVSAYRFILNMREAGLGYRRTDMLGDWRRLIKQEEKKEKLRYVRKDRYPTTTIMAGLSKDAGMEFLYKVKFYSRVKPDEPLTTGFVNLPSNIPMTPAMVEAEVAERWGDWQESAPGALVSAEAWTVFRKGL